MFIPFITQRAPKMKSQFFYIVAILLFNRKDLTVSEIAQ